MRVAGRCEGLEDEEGWEEEGGSTAVSASSPSAHTPIAATLLELIDGNRHFRLLTESVFKFR